MYIHATCTHAQVCVAVPVCYQAQVLHTLLWEGLGALWHQGSDHPQATGLGYLLYQRDRHCLMVHKRDHPMGSLVFQRDCGEGNQAQSLLYQREWDIACWWYKRENPVVPKGMGHCLLVVQEGQYQREWDIACWWYKRDNPVVPKGMGLSCHN